jgi:hypothetical protein
MLCYQLRLLLVGPKACHVLFSIFWLWSIHVFFFWRCAFLFPMLYRYVLWRTLVHIKRVRYERKPFGIRLFAAWYMSSKGIKEGNDPSVICSNFLWNPITVWLSIIRMFLMKYLLHVSCIAFGILLRYKKQKVGQSCGRAIFQLFCRDYAKFMPRKTA